MGRPVRHMGDHDLRDGRVPFLDHTDAIRPTCPMGSFPRCALANPNPPTERDKMEITLPDLALLVFPILCACKSTRYHRGALQKCQ